MYGAMKNGTPIKMDDGKSYADQLDIITNQMQLFNSELTKMKKEIKKLQNK